MVLGNASRTVSSTVDATRVQGRITTSAVPRALRPFWVQLLLALAVAAVACPPGFAATFRYSASSNRIYVENGGVAYLSDIKAAVPDAPLDLVDADRKIWMLRANLVIEDGSTLRLHGEANAGDVNELRLQSAGSNYVYITAEYGHLDIHSTRIHSWNPGTPGVDTEYATGRAWIRVRSFLDPDGVTPRESRMDVVNSEISYLGFAAAESYGLVWKVIGAEPNLYELVAVRGDIRDSRIHHNYFGVYTYGHQAGQWTGNEVSHNVQYGFDPHDDSDDLLIENNNVHHNGNHGIIASMRCDSIVIRNNLSWANTGNGIMLHRSSSHALVEGNQSYENADAGIAIFGSEFITVRNNVFSRNARGIRLSVGANDNTIEDNEVRDNQEYGLYLYRGTDVPEPNDDGRNKRNLFRGNLVSGSGERGLQMKEGDDNRFIGNRFADNGLELVIENSRNTRFIRNRIPPNVTVSLSGGEVTGSVSFRDQDQVTVRLENLNTAEFESPKNAIFQPDESIATVVEGATGSRLRLQSPEIGGMSTVHQRTFFVTPETGTASIVPLVWQVAGERRKVFTSRASTAGARVDYVVGDLEPGASYDVLRGSTVIRTLRANDGGRIRFAVAGKTRDVRFTVQPTAP